MGGAEQRNLANRKSELMILAIETSTPVCSVALQATAPGAWEKRIEGRGVHSERLFTFTDELLDRAGVGVADLDAILFSRGPGSYTGLRIGASAIKGLLFGRKIPLFTFPTLFSFAAGLQLDSRPRNIFSVIDARRTHLYVQRFDWSGSELKRSGDASVKELTAIKDELTRDSVIVGTGWNRLNLDQESKIKTYGTETISATNLISAWENSDLKPHFRKEDPKSFDPDYLEIAQINNNIVR
jgi:tRNA threonylcarbamoyl adenosine modification protein YeaZ